MNGPSILLFDADDMLREVTAAMLVREGAAVTTTSTLEEAIERATQRRYDVAVLDLALESEDGSKIVEALRENDCLPSRVIVCCSNGTPFGGDGADSPPADSAGSARVWSVTEVIQKPFPFDRLVEATFRLRPPPEPARSASVSWRPIQHRPRPHAARFGGTTEAARTARPLGARIARAAPRVARSVRLR